MIAGQRIRLRYECVWPERRGCEGVTVEPRSDGIYPQPAKWEVLVKLDDDPLGHNDWWTCVMSAKDVDVIEANG